MSIEAELEELLKLRRWERSESCLTMGKSKSARQKLKKLLKKYTVRYILIVVLALFC